MLFGFFEECKMISYIPCYTPALQADNGYRVDTDLLNARVKMAALVSISAVGLVWLIASTSVLMITATVLTAINIGLALLDRKMANDEADCNAYEHCLKQIGRGNSKNLYISALQRIRENLDPFLKVKEACEPSSFSLALIQARWKTRPKP